jgi:hypothetical protein
MDLGIRGGTALVCAASKGLGKAAPHRSMLEFLKHETDLPLLIGMWKAATWALRFYERRGFRLVSDEEKKRLFKRYWNVPQRQIEESAVLSR